MDIFTQADGTARVFLVLALAGTAFFLLRVVAGVVGGFGEHVADGPDAHHDVGGHHAPHAPHGETTDVAFKLISLNSITGFIMMFGWVGLAAYKDRGWSAPAAMLAGLLGGVATMYLTAYLFRAAMRLATPGARFSIAKTVGGGANVYVAIPAEGRGQVQVSANGMLHTLEAVSEDRVPLESFASVTIVRMIDERTVSVRKA